MNLEEVLYLPYVPAVDLTSKADCHTTPAPAITWISCTKQYWYEKCWKIALKYDMNQDSKKETGPKGGTLQQVLQVF